MMATELRGFAKAAEPNSEFSSQIQLKSTEELFKPHPCRRWGNILLVVVVILIAIGAGFAAGYFIKPKTRSETKDPAVDKQRSMNKFHEMFVTMVDTKEMEKNLRFFTNRPHVATSKAADAIGDFLKDKWQEFGFEVEEPEYEVPISLPLDDKPNTVTVINNDTRAVEHHINVQLNITASTDSSKMFKYTPYLAYTPNATVEGQMVYANRGTEWDFNDLKERNITVKGRLVIMGSLFGSVHNAQKYGAIGAILYPDPIMYAQKGHTFNETYPNSPWLPPDAIQRISEAVNIGDPYTPLLPSTKGMYRLPESQVKFPRIPAQTISYDEARYIMSRMGGVKVPERMQGGLNIDYRFGPLMSNTTTTSIVKLQTHNQIYTRKVRNVIATIPGTQEPDRIVMIGNHRDAWTFGSSDPSSGTTTLTEISRILSELYKEGWRPRRTIKLCSWGGEEMGLLGSNEWVEENDQMIRQRVVTYLNTDVAVGGNFVVFVQTSSVLHEVILKHTKKITDPQNTTRTLYDNMLARMSRSKDYPNEPQLNSFEYVSDNIPFCLFSGVSTADFSYFFGYKDKKVLLYPVYHSQFDTFEWIKKFADPEFLHFKAMTQLLGSILMDVSDTAILPFSVQRLGRSLENAYTQLNLNYKFAFHNSHVVLSELKLAISKFMNTTKDFESAKQKLTGQESLLVLRRFNDQMANLEKVFVSPYVHTEPHRKLVFKEIFLSIYDVMSKFRNKKNETAKRDEIIQFELSLILHAVRSATTLIKPLV